MTDNDWPDNWPDPDKIKRDEKATRPAPDDWLKGKKGKGRERREQDQRPPKEKVPPTWGRNFFAEYEGKGKKHKGGHGDRPTPVDRQALKQQLDDAEWAADQQQAIAKANQRQASAARKANEWQAAADREIAQVNRRYWQSDEQENTGSDATDRQGGGCRLGCSFVSLPGWIILLIILYLLADIWMNG